MSRELRANLFLAYGYFLLVERGIASMGRFPGMYHKAMRLQKTIDPAITAEHERNIGPEWSYILRHSKTYAGLSFENLARAIGKEFSRWYETVYHFQSIAVHAVDILRHIDVAEGSTLKAAYLSKEHDVFESLWPAIGMFLTHMHLLHKHIGFGPDVDIALQSLKQKFRRIAARTGTCS